METYVLFGFLTTLYDPQPSGEDQHCLYLVGGRLGHQWADFNCNFEVRKCCLMWALVCVVFFSKDDISYNFCQHKEKLSQMNFLCELDVNPGDPWNHPWPQVQKGAQCFPKLVITFLGQSFC